MLKALQPLPQNYMPISISESVSQSCCFRQQGPYKMTDRDKHNTTHTDG